MKNSVILGLLLIVPRTLWLANEGSLALQNGLRRATSAPLVAIGEQEENEDSDDVSLSTTSPSVTSPTSPPPVGIRLNKKSFNHRHPTNTSKYPEDNYQLVGFYEREDGKYAPLYRSKAGVK